MPLAQKDRWNAVGPHRDNDFAQYVARPELARCSRSSTPASSRTSAALNADRADLLAVLLTGIPAGLVPGFQNFTGPTQADVLRLNVAIPPSASPNRLGLIGATSPGSPTAGG